MGWKFWQRGERPKPIEEEVKPVSPPHKTYRIGNVSIRVDLVMPDQHTEITANGSRDAESVFRAIQSVLSEKYIISGDITPDKKLLIKWHAISEPKKGDKRGMLPSFAAVCAACSELEDKLKTPSDVQKYIAERTPAVSTSDERPTAMFPAFVQREISPIVDTIMETLAEQGIKVPEGNITLDKKGALLSEAEKEGVKLGNQLTFREMLEIRVEKLRKSQNKSMAASNPHAPALHATQFCLAELNIDCPSEFLDALEAKLQGKGQAAAATHSA